MKKLTSFILIAAVLAVGIAIAFTVPHAAPFVAAMFAFIFAFYIVPHVIAWLTGRRVVGVLRLFGQAGATLGQSGKVTLLDWAKSIDPNGNTADVAELLTQQNEILLDMPFIEGNLPTGHRTTIRTGLPTAVWRQLYQGVPPSKSVRAQVDDACGMLETRSEVDKDLADLNGNAPQFRLSEANAFVESMNQTMASTLFYGNTAINPERFMGLAPRFAAISGATNAQNVIDAGGSGTDNTSVWLVVWGKNTVTGIFPKGSKAGLFHEDLGLIDAFDANNNRYRAYADRWQWKTGLTVRDWRYVVRVCNIDVSDLVGLTGTQAVTASTAVIRVLIRAMARIPYPGMGTPVFYANRTVKEMLSVQAMDKSQSALSIVDSARQFGGVTVSVPELRFFGVPIRSCDQILTTEARVT
jgi:hypothetical protein